MEGKGTGDTTKIAKQKKDRETLRVTIEQSLFALKKKKKNEE